MEIASARRLVLTGLLILLLAAAGIGTVAWLRAARRESLRDTAHVTLEPDYSKIPGGSVDGETMERVRQVLLERVASLGLLDPEIRIQPNRRIVVIHAGITGKPEVLNMLTRKARLEFRHLKNVRTAADPRGAYRMQLAQDASGADIYTFIHAARKAAVSQQSVLKEAPLILDGSALRPSCEAVLNPASGGPLVRFELTPEGAERLKEFTSKNVGAILAIVFDGTILSAPSIVEPITEGAGQIGGGFKSMADAKSLADLLNAGPLPVPLRVAPTPGPR
jgi:protein-export membrane protein SecD